MPTEFPLDRFRDYLAMLARMEMQKQVRHKFDPSDIVQQTLMEAHRCQKQFQGDTSGQMAAWLRQILARQMADALRRFQRAKRDARQERSLEAALAESSLRLGGMLPSDESSPSQKAEQHERAIQLAEAMGQLPEAQREALILQHWQSWSLAEIAVHMERSPAAVAGLLKRGLRGLRNLLPDEDEGDGR